MACITSSLAVPYGVSAAGQGSVLNVQWPGNAINLSQLENIITQNPAFSQFNLRFPNQVNWSLTPSYVQNLTSTFQQEAQSIGGSGKPENLSFSSVLGAAMQGSPVLNSGLVQLSIRNLAAGNLQGGSLKAQMDTVLSQLQAATQDNGESGFFSTIKHYILVFYNAVYDFFSSLGEQLGRLVHR